MKIVFIALITACALFGGFDIDHVSVYHDTNGKEYTIKRQSIAPCKEYKTAPDDVWKLGNVS
ncbi:MAG: hypothetical protein ACQESH_04690, partial [Campylobacterota bacterium]